MLASHQQATLFVHTYDSEDHVKMKYLPKLRYLFTINKQHACFPPPTTLTAIDGI